MRYPPPSSTTNVSVTINEPALNKHHVLCRPWLSTRRCQSSLLSHPQFQYAGQHSPIPDHYFHHHHNNPFQDSDFLPHMSPHHQGHSVYPAASGYGTRRGSSSLMGAYSSNGYGGGGGASGYGGEWREGEGGGRRIGITTLDVAFLFVNPLCKGAGAPSHLVGHFSSASTSSLTGLGLNSGGCGSGSETTSTTTNLIVNNLPQDMSERELYSLFVTMGPIESCRVMRDLKTGYSYGFGFVNFISDESALRAIKCLNGLTIRSKRIKVRRWS